MRSIEIKGWNKDASVSRLVQATFPSYRRKTVYIEARETVCLHDLNWSGGTRCEYRACTLDGQEAGSSARYNAMAPWDARQIEGMELPVPQGFVVVCGGHFCGKESLIRITVNPADMPKYITHQAAE